jgi:hypothetical protein
MGFDVNSLPDSEEPDPDHTDTAEKRSSELRDVIQSMDRTQKDLLSGLANAARLAETAIPKFEAPSIPSLPPMIVRPEVTLLRDLRDDQADQGAALAQMAAGISQLAIHAEAADERGKSEERKSSRLIALTIVIVVLAAATLIATLLH